MSLSKFQEIVKDKEAWHAAVHRVTKSQTRLSNSATTTIISCETAVIHLTNSQVIVVHILFSYYYFEQSYLLGDLRIRKIKILFYSHFFLLPHCSLVLCMLSFWPVIFLLPEELLKFLLGIYWWQISLNVCLYFFFTFKGKSYQIQVTTLVAVFFEHCEYFMPLFSCLHGVWWELQGDSYLCYSIGKQAFLVVVHLFLMTSGCFHDFLFVFHFSVLWKWYA